MEQYSVQGQGESTGGAPCRILNRLGRGQYFGEMALLGNGRRNATVRASGLTPVKVVELDRTALEHLMRKSAEFKEDLEQRIDERQSSLPQDS